MTKCILLVAALMLLQLSIASDLPVELSPALRMDSCEPPDKSEDANGFCPASPLAAARQKTDNLAVRQTGHCIDPGYYRCPNDGIHCCPAGYNCCKNNCCKKGTECCNEGCKLPGGECCGNSRSCPPGSKCTTEGSTSVCERPCPEVTTRTTTVTRTQGDRSTTTITKTAVRGEGEEGEQGEFSCVPLTVTNGVGDTLELGDDCDLTFEPGDDPPPSSSSKAPHAALKKKKNKNKRARDCPPTRTTRTVFKTVSQTNVRTATTTVTKSESALPEFSCPPMTVTNDNGDELTMDEECALGFSPGDTTPTGNGKGSPATGSGAPAQPTNTSGGAGKLHISTGNLVTLLGGIYTCVVWLVL